MMKTMVWIRGVWRERSESRGLSWELEPGSEIVEDGTSRPAGGASVEIVELL